MGVILQVGEHHEMVKPPENFPKCNSFVPEVQALSGVQRIEFYSFSFMIFIINSVIYSFLHSKILF